MKLPASNWGSVRPQRQQARRFVGALMWGAAVFIVQASPARAGGHFQVVANRPFGARCNGPMGAIVIEEGQRRPGVTAAATMAAASAVQTQHSVTRLQRAARPLRVLASRGILRGPLDPRFPRIAVHVTPTGDLVLPDLVAAMQTQQSLGNPNNNIRVTFQGFDAGVQAAFQGYLQTAIPVAKSIYGSPAFDLDVTVINDSSVTDLQGGYYDVTTNEIHMAPPTGNLEEDTFVLLKLLLHAFHDDAFMFFDAWEDGFAGAAATAIQTTPGVSPGYNPYDPGPFYALSVYECQNQPPLGNSTFYPASGFGGMLVWRIAMARAAWLKCYIENPSFFARFNEEYYRRYSPSLAGDTASLKDIGALVLPSVEGMSFYEWYNNQWVLDTSIRTGPKLFVWNIPLRDAVALIVEHYVTDSTGNETPRGGQAYTVYWSYDFSVSLYAEEGNVIPVADSGESAGEGWLLPTFYNIGGPQRITVQVDLNNLRGYYPFPYGVRGYDPGEYNIYGALLGAIQGQVEISGAASATGIQAARGVWGKEIMNGNLRPAQVTVTYVAPSGDRTSRTVNVGWDSYMIVLRGGTHTTLSRTFSAGVHLISLPLYTLTPSAPDVLGLPAEKLLLARWDPRLGGAGRYRLWPDCEGFAPGKAFFIKLLTDHNLRVKGLVPDADSDFSVPLQYGWNMVGVPRTAPVNLSDLRVQVGLDPSVPFAEAVTRQWVQSTVYGYSMARGYQQATVLEPFQGYWVRCLVPSEVRLIFPGGAGRAAAPAAVGPSDSNTAGTASSTSRPSRGWGSRRPAKNR
ncbi:MAG: hypothetical protein N2512_11945 [Armatimonadetes bacterium]|nr:hypothetical protein [Armatimonadota bacterium]